MLKRQWKQLTKLGRDAWQLGWAVGPSISGIVQEQHGFTPLFITTGILYASAIIFTWFLFEKTKQALPIPTL